MTDQITQAINAMEDVLLTTVPAGAYPDGPCIEQDEYDALVDALAALKAHKAALGVAGEPVAYMMTSDNGVFDVVDLRGARRHYAEVLAPGYDGDVTAIPLYAAPRTEREET